MTLKVFLGNGFGQDISNLVLRPDGIDFDKTIANVLAKVMETRVDMLGAWAEFGKTGKFEGTGVILKCFAVNVGYVCNDLKPFLFYFLNRKHDWKYVAERL